jgi:hypothetical protein
MGYAQKEAGKEEEETGSFERINPATASNQTEEDGQGT